MNINYNELQGLNDFNRLLFEARFVDMRYSHKFNSVLMPDGVFLWNKFASLFKAEFYKLDYREYSFPEFLSIEEVQKIYSLKNFDQTNYVVRDSRKDIAILRPTGDASVFPMFKLWIKSYHDLPLKAIHDTKYFRNTRKTSPFFGKRIFRFIEAFSAHETLEDSEREFERVIEHMSDFYHTIDIHPFRVKRPLHGNNSELNIQNVGFDEYLRIGRTSQVGCAYLQGDIFAKQFGICYKNTENATRFVHQINFGISESALGAYLLNHLDPNGLVFHMAFAPVQICIVPISESPNNDLDLMAKRIDELLKNTGYRVETSQNLYPHSLRKTIRTNCQHARLRGIPFKIIIGQKEIDGNFVTVERRDSMSYSVDSSNILEFIRTNTKAIDDYASAVAYKETPLTSIKNINELIDAYPSSPFAYIPLCSQTSCQSAIENLVTGEVLGSLLDKHTEAPCIICQNDANQTHLVSRRL